VYDRKNKTDKVTSGHGRPACNEGVLEVAMSANHQENQTINRPVAFSKVLAQVKTMQNKTSNTTWAVTVSRKNVLALNIENCKLFGCSTLDNTILASQERESGN